jgi:hypothetical protein
MPNMAVICNRDKSTGVVHWHAQYLCEINWSGTNLVPTTDRWTATLNQMACVASEDRGW